MGLRTATLLLIGLSLGRFDTGSKTIDGITHSLSNTPGIRIHDDSLLLAYKDGVALFDIRSGHAIRSFRGLHGPIVQMSLSPDGRWVATASSNANPDYVVSPLRERIQIWDVETGKLKFEQNARVGMSFGWTPDSSVVFTHDTTTRAWEVTSGKELPPFPGVVAFSPKGDIALISQTENISVVSYPSRTERCRSQSWPAKGPPVFSADGRALVQVARDTTKGPAYGPSVGFVVRIWNSSTCGLSHQFPIAGNWFSHAALTQDGKLLVNLGKPASAVLMNAETGAVERTFATSEAQFVTDALLSPDNRHLLTRWSFHHGYDQDFCSLWDVGSGRELHRWTEGFAGRSGCVGFSGDGHTVPIASYQQQGLQSVWNADSGELIRSFP